jgi:hypothetical protein
MARLRRYEPSLRHDIGPCNRRASAWTEKPYIAL